MPLIRSLYEYPLHLGLGARAIPQPAFTGIEWYEDYAARNCDDGVEGRLVGLYRFTESWDSWEMHPAGEEVVVCIAGQMTLIQEFAGGQTRQLKLATGDYAINPPGVWHTADINGEATGLFITAGIGTEHRPR